MTRGTRWAGWAVAVAVLALYLSAVAGHVGGDLRVLWQAGVDVRHGADPYHGGFDYLPSALLAAWPLGMLPLHVAATVQAAVDLAALAGLCELACRRFGRASWAGWVTALAMFTAPVSSTMRVLNVTPLVVLAAFAFVFDLDRNPRRAGLWLGLSLALKPMAAPLLLLALPADRRRAVLPAVAVPACLSVVAFAATGRGVGFFTYALPLLSHLSEGFAVKATIHAPLAVAGLRAAVLLAAGWVAWWRHRDGTSGLVDAATVLLLGSMLAGTVAWQHYLVILLPVAAGMTTRRMWLAVPLLVVAAVDVAGLPQVALTFAASAVVGMLAAPLVRDRALRVRPGAAPDRPLATGRQSRAFAGHRVSEPVVPVLVPQRGKAGVDLHPHVGNVDL